MVGEGEVLFEFVRKSDRTHVRCELRHHGDWGAEALLFFNGQLVLGRRFDSREAAVQWANLERPAHEIG
jgi:hypothetical protein